MRLPIWDIHNIFQKRKWDGISDRREYLKQVITECVPYLGQQTDVYK